MKKVKFYQIKAVMTTHVLTGNPRSNTLYVQPTVRKKIQAVSESQAWFYCYQNFPKRSHHMQSVTEVGEHTDIHDPKNAR